MIGRVLDDDPWTTTSVRHAQFSELHATGALPELPCPACGFPTLPRLGMNHICVVCHWEDDGTSRAQPDRRSAVNLGLTLREAGAHIAETGVFASRWHALTAPEYYLPKVTAARAALVAAYERLRVAPQDSAVRADVHQGRAALMRAIVTEMR
jgi:hypothetical protein